MSDTDACTTRGEHVSTQRHARAECPVASDPDITITVSRSAGTDNAVVVFIDTTFEPDGSDGGPGLRVRVNDADVTEEGCRFVAFTAADDHIDRESTDLKLEVALDALRYATPTTLTRERLAYLRTQVEGECMSWGEVAELQAAFEAIDPATLPEPPENAGWSDMLDELEARLED